MKQHVYLCIDLKSFYASVECVERGLDPMTTNLVVADPTRTEKTICLAISPSMKALGIKNRCRVFQIPKNVEYIMAPPRMQTYIEYSANIYAIYLRYIAKEDIQVYSIDEAFMDVTDYLELYQMSAKELGITIMNDIRKTLGVTATCGVGTNLYLAKIALDITAKHSPDFVGELTEQSYQEKLWGHQPITDFWRVGPGIAKRLAHNGIYTMGDIARAPEDLLYRLIGVDAQILIDHAWGREPTTITEIKAFKPQTNSLSSGQVLSRDYSFEEGELIVKEMTDLLCLDLVDRQLVTDSISLYVGYSNELDRTPARGSTHLSVTTSSVRILTDAMVKLYRRSVDPQLPIRRMTLAFNHVVDESYEQYDLLTDPAQMAKDRKIQQAVNSIKKKYGKNSILKGMNLQTDCGATTIERNGQIGGHKSGTT